MGETCQWGGAFDGEQKNRDGEKERKRDEEDEDDQATDIQATCTTSLEVDKTTWGNKDAMMLLLFLPLLFKKEEEEEEEEMGDGDSIGELSETGRGSNAQDTKRLFMCRHPARITG